MSNSKSRIELIQEKVKLENEVRNCSCRFGGWKDNVCIKTPSCDDKCDRIAEIEEELLKLLTGRAVV